MENLAHHDLAELQVLYRRRRVSPVEVVSAHLERIADLDGELNSFITVTADEALRAAREAEQQVMSCPDPGQLPPLFGIPVAVKDILDVKGTPTTCASTVTGQQPAASDAEVVERLRQTGAIVTGKNNLLEFAYGGIHEAFGPVVNPWNPEYTAGGSSSGSAAAVAASLVPVSFGTDTTGSVRGPASYCGVVGFKPTYDRISRAGLTPLSWSLDHIGPLTRTVRDAAVAFGAVSAADAVTANDRESVVDGLGAGVDGLRVGVLERETTQGVDGEITDAVKVTAAALAERGADTRWLTIPGLRDAVAPLLVIMQAEASAYHRTWLQERSDDYTAPVRHRLQLGTMLQAVDYVQAQRYRRRLCQHLAAAMEDVDILLLPTTPTPPPPVAGYEEMLDADPDGDNEEDLTDLFWRFAPFNMTGQPAVTMPAGLSESGLPLGVQLAGRPGEDARVLQAAHACEQARSRERPPLLKDN